MHCNKWSETAMERLKKMFKIPLHMDEHAIVIPFLISLNFWSIVLLFLYIRSSLLYFMCTRIASLYAFNEFKLLMKRKKKKKRTSGDFPHPAEAAPLPKGWLATSMDTRDGFQPPLNDKGGATSYPRLFFFLSFYVFLLEMV
jgi:hypothetical protein